MPWGVAAAVVGAGLSASASNKAAKKQEQAANQALGFQQDQANQVRLDTAAQREIGTNAINKLADILGVERSAPTAPDRNAFYSTSGGGSSASGLQGNGNYVELNGRKVAFDPVGSKLLGGKKKKSSEPEPVFDQYGYDQAVAKYQKDLDAFNNRKLGMDAWTPDPGYQFRLDNTNKTIDRYQSAGRVTGGRAIKEAMRYGQDFASNEFGNATNRLFTLAGYGQPAINTAASAGANAANNMSNVVLQNGQNQANNIANINNAIQGGIGNLTTYKTYNDWTRRLSQPTGFSPGNYRGPVVYGSDYGE